MTSPEFDHVHDLVGIGIGPFNLGLACLSEPLDLDTVFLDAAEEFRWHRGMMIEGATIQVPFLADLVSMADPTSPFSFLNWLKRTGRLYPFYIQESFFPLRAEYDAYCRWASEQLPNLRWGRHVTAIEYDGGRDVFRIRSERRGTGEVEQVQARHVVLGVGTRPYIPEPVRDLPGSAPHDPIQHGPALRGPVLRGPVLHSADYLDHRDRLRASDSIMIIGSGQSAAEIYRDLLDGIRDGGYRLDWVTRSPRFFPMEYTKLTLELTSPEYTDHFHGLPAQTRQRLGRDQRALYKGISGELVDDIYDTLYRLSAAGPVPTTLLTETELLGADSDGEHYRVRLRQTQLDQTYERRTGALVLATGYTAETPKFLDPIRDRLDWDPDGRLAVARDYSVDAGRGRIFVQNGEEHTHGLTAPDLGFGAWRNSAILAAITGAEPYPVERRIAFQEFGIPADAEPIGGSTGSPHDVTGSPHDVTGSPHVPAGVTG